MTVKGFVECPPLMPDLTTADSNVKTDGTENGIKLRFAEVVLMTLVLVTAFSIWYRNRDILSDMYDYSSVIVSAGKVEAGLKPYADFRSPMQSACYVLSRGVEKVFGRNYLSLTYGGLILIWGGALLLQSLWRRQFSPMVAVALTGAVTLGGLAQHVVIFYNPVGLLCLAVVVAGMPLICREKNPWNWRGLAVVGALILGGTNKINFHGLAMGMAGLIVLAAAVRNEISWKRLWVWWVGLLLVGLGLPLALELAWTGVSLQVWFYNVVQLVEERVGFVGLIFAPRMYVGSTFDLHRFIMIKPLHSIGLVIILGLMIAAWRSTTGAFAKVALIGLAVAGGAGGVLLAVTNVESIALTSQGTLVAAIAVAASYGLARQKFAQVWLVVAAGLWLVVGGFAAWQGSRVLYARNDFDRSTFKRVVDPSETLRYLDGVRLDAGLSESLGRLAVDLERIKKRDGDLSRVWFGPALEWLERPYPESIMPGMPVWYHLGTSLRESDGPWLIESLEKKDIEYFYTHPGWEEWPRIFQNYLDEFYRRTPVGILRAYERRSGQDTAKRSLKEFLLRDQVLAMLQQIGSTVHLGTTDAVATDSPQIYTSPWGDYYGAKGDWVWNWTQPVRETQASFVVSGLAGLEVGAAVTASFQIVADPAGAREVVAEKRFSMTAKDPVQRYVFEFNAHGRTVALETSIEGEGADQVVTGWRDMRILHVGDTEAQPPPPGLQSPIDAVAGETPDGKASWRRWMGEIDENSSEITDWARQPFEMWTPAPAEIGEWKATLEIEPLADSGGVVPIIMLVWVKAGRFEIMDQFAPPKEKGTFTVKGRMPESGGWIGVAVRSVEVGRPLHSRLRLLRWSE